MKFSKTLLTLISILIGSTVMFAFNYLFLEHILIPDPCYYHNRETTMIFDLFYDLPSREGYHPSPTSFNFLITLIVGAFLGWYFAKILIKLFLKARSS